MHRDGNYYSQPEQLVRQSSWPGGWFEALAVHLRPLRSFVPTLTTARVAHDPHVLRYGASLVSVVLAISLAFLFFSPGPGASSLFLAAVMVSAWYGGLGPGLVATTLSAVALEFLVPLLYSLSAGSAGRLRLCLFVFAALVISSLNAIHRRLERHLLRQDQRKQEFLAVLAHEIRGPLSAISNAAQAMRLETTEASSLERATAIIDRQVHVVTRLIDDVLDASRIRLGKLRLFRKRVDLSSVVSNALEATRCLIEARRQCLEVSVPSGPLYVEGDPVRLGQIIVNLLTNAARYTEPGGQIRLIVERRNGELLLRVRDNGIGLAPDALPRVFDMFAQVEDASGGGLGIGLSLVRDLARLHGGTVSASSDGLGEGSEFVVRLPESPTGENGGPRASNARP